MSEPITHNYCTVLSYDGSAYYGWQRLREHPTLQAAVESALERYIGEPVAIRGAGRTDRGAHAQGQVAGFALAEARPVQDLLIGLNHALPADIRALSVHAVPPEFHVRTAAVEKTYEYRLVNPDSNVRDDHADTRVWKLKRAVHAQRMHTAAQHLVGCHDFASFATKPRFKQRSTEREMYQADVEQRNGLIVLTFRANSFLNHMVRNMVGALARVGEGRYAPDRIATVLDKRDRAASPGSAPAGGLYLMNVRYDPAL